MAAMAILLAVSCSDVATEIDNGVLTPELHYKPFVVELQSGVESPEEEEQTRMLVGEITSKRVYYHWNERDSIGVFLLNIPTKQGNHFVMGERDEENKNLARFTLETKVPEGYEASDVDAFVYYPYNPSLVQVVEGQSGAEYLAKGLTYRVPYMQTQLPSEQGEIGCTEVMSRYGIAYDLLACEGTTGNFTMQHQTAYFRFKIVGGEGEDGSYAQDCYRLKRVTVQAGKRKETSSLAADTHYSLTERVNLSGTFRVSLDYNEEEFDGSQRLGLLSGGGAPYVATELKTAQPLSEPVWVFMALSPDNLWDLSKNGERFMQVEMEVEVYDDQGEFKQIVTCTRYIPLAGRTVERGSLYDVSLEFSAPLDTYSVLDAEEPANTYVIPAGGNYLFSAEIPGNGVTPYATTWDDLAAEGIPQNLIEEGKRYAVDWLWASGSLFEGRTVDEVLTECIFNPVDNSVQLTINPEIPSSELKGNLVVALYETDENGAFKSVAWSWLLWLAQPEDHYFYFANTRPGVDLNNSEWHVMDRNIGAEEAGLGIRSVGLYYQLGRKDPFVGPSSRGTAGVVHSDTEYYVYEAAGSYDAAWENNRLATLTNTEVFGAEVASWQSGKSQGGDLLPHRYPMHLLSRSTELHTNPVHHYAWVHAAEQNATQTKTLFDPCPPGYKLPTTREWDNLKNSKYEFTTPAATGYGPLGYAHYHYNAPWALPVYTESPWTFPASTNGLQTTYYAYGEVKVRCDAGEYYEVDYDNGSAGYGTMGRLYHVGSMSREMENVALPATGALSETGEYKYLPLNITLWSSGRIDEVRGTFEGYWFGIKANGETNYANNYREEWGEWSSEIWAFYTPSLFTNPFGASSAGLPSPTLYYNDGVVVGKSNSIDYAAPVRCIRTYNSTNLPAL